MKVLAHPIEIGPRAIRGTIALLCALLLVPGEGIVLAQSAPAATPAAAAEEADDPPLTADQLDSLVAPIALFPDDLLAQCLAASTYPLELVQLQQWMGKHKDLKDKALADAVGKEDWDPSVKSMAAVPDALKRLTEDIQWTTDLGNAFLAQQKEVMDACQRMRKKASDKGALKSNEQMKVETKVVESKEVIVVQSSNPEVIYVPSYNPTVVYPPPVYPYPPVYYPPYTPGAAFFTFSAGMVMGAAIWGGSCCGCGWGGGNVNVNVNNNFNKNTNVGGGNRGQGGGNWNHNPSHRGGTPYGNKATAGKYGGQTRGQQASARQQGGRGTSNASNRGGGAGDRGGSSRPSAGTSDRGGAGDRGGGGDRGGASASDRSSGGSRGGGGADRAGSRDVGGGGSRGGSSGFGGGSGGFSGSSARSSSSRGSSSMGSRGGGGGGSRGGGGGRGGRR